MNKTVRRIIIGVLFAVVVLALAWPKLKSTGEVATGGPPQGGGASALRVEAYVIHPRLLRDRIHSTGTIRANEEVELRSETSGKITHLYFQEGRPVRKDTLLVKINDSELQAQLRKAEYRETLAVDREERQRQLYEKGGISQEEYEATLNELNVLKADVDLIQAQITKTEIRAPFDGVVGLRQVSEGSYISTTTPIATIQDVNPVKIDFSIPERYAQRVKIGDTIFFNVAGLQGPYQGTIYALEPRIEANTRTLLLRARSPNPDGRLLPGAFADIELIFEEIPNAITVPAIAVIPELGGKKVYVVEGGKAVSRSIETGIRMEEEVQVTQGLAALDTVLVSGIQLIRPGLPVEVTLPGQDTQTAE